MQDTKNLKRGIYIFLGAAAALMILATVLFIAGGGRSQTTVAAAPTQGPTVTLAPTNTPDPNVTPSPTPDDILPTEEEGRQFLEENAKAEGVVTTASGLQYKVITKGNSTQTPAPTDTVTVNYRGTLVDGTQFDANNGISFPLNGVIAGWTEGVGLMSPGDTFMLYIPPELAYGNRQQGPLIPPNSTLVFEVTLVSIN